MKRKTSIRFRMTIILIFIVGWVIVFTWFLNSTFAESYYIFIEKESIVDTFSKTKNILETEDNSASAAEELNEVYIKTNIRMMAVTSDNYFYKQSEASYSNMTEGSQLYKNALNDLNQLRGRLILNTTTNETFSSATDGAITNKIDYTALQQKGYYVLLHNTATDGRSGIYLFGLTDNGYLVGLQVPIESIQSSASISSRLMAYIGATGIFLGSIIIFIYASSFTKPIKKMAHAANRMAGLDFDTKIEVKRDDELGELGSSMNQMSEKLESAIGDLKAANLELQQDIEKKEQIDEMRKEFLSHVSHELKTPIALIQGYAEGLMENITDDEESRNFYCEVIRDEAKKMNTMVRKLLTLNQIEFGNNQIDMQHFDICQMIQNKINASQILFLEKNVTVIFQEKSPVLVWADEMMIEEVFSNYLSNALNHVYQNGTIRVWFETAEEDLRIHVYNDGDRIPEEDIDKLWIKFYKVDKARTREYGGNGIGLSIVAATMNAHGKAYGVTNKENGVDFYFDLDVKN